MIPGAMVNAEDIENVSFPSKSSSDSNVLSEDELATEANSTVSRVPARKSETRKKKADENIDVLHREVLQLQKEKLLLRIKILRKQVADTSDASTQTDFCVEPYSFLKELHGDW